MSNKRPWDNSHNISKLESQFSPAAGNVFSLTGGGEYFFELKNEAHYLGAYQNCPPLKAVIGKRAKAFNTAKLEILDASTGNYSTSTAAKSLMERLDRPNILQTETQFFTQQNIYIDIFGYCPVLVMRPVGFKDEITAIWNIPPWLFDIKYTGKYVNQLSIKDIYAQYFMYWGDKKETLNFDDLFFVFDDGIGTETDTNLTIPDSRLLGLEYPVSNIVAAYKSRNTLITKRGAVGILSNDSKDAAGLTPILTKDKEGLQSDFKKYGIVGQPYQIIITDAALKWQQMGFATKDLLLFEEIEDDIFRICDSYGYPAELISSAKGTTYANKKEAKIDFYVDTVIPEAKSRLEQFARALLPEKSGLLLQWDFSDVEILQDDTKTKAEARKALNEALEMEYRAGLITKNDWLEALGRDRRPDREFDEYYRGRSEEEEEEEEDENTITI